MSIEFIGQSAAARILSLSRELKRRIPWQPQRGPQQAAFASEADIIGFGGAAGGGKTACLVGMALLKHHRCLIVRRERAQTEGIIQYLAEICGGTAGYNAQKSLWRVPVGNGPLIEFGGLDNPGDERRWQGRAHDFLALDEATEIRESQARFIMGWVRTSRKDVTPRIMMTFNPPASAEGRWVLRFFAPWLDPLHPNPAKPGELRWFTTVGDEDTEVPDARPFVIGKTGERIYDFDPGAHAPETILAPKSRTFIPARVTDNRYYLESGYIAQLQSLPEPLRSQLLSGDFNALVKDDVWQAIPTAWIEAAFARWEKKSDKGRMTALGFDVARGGSDRSVVARRHGNWFDELVVAPGAMTGDGGRAAGFVAPLVRNGACVCIDAIGIGGAAFDFCRGLGMNVLAVVGSASSAARSSDGNLRFRNRRAEMFWKLREALDPTNEAAIALCPDAELLAELAAIRYQVATMGQDAGIQIRSKDEIRETLGKSPDKADALAMTFLSGIPLPGAREAARKFRAGRGAGRIV